MVVRTVPGAVEVLGAGWGPGFPQVVPRAEWGHRGCSSHTLPLEPLDIL